MEIKDSARKHGVSDEDMLHAVRRYEDVWPQGEGLWMIIGPTWSGHLTLEIGVIVDEFGVRIIHAMKARRKFLR